MADPISVTTGADEQQVLATVLNYQYEMFQYRYDALPADLKTHITPAMWATAKAWIATWNAANPNRTPRA